MKTKVIIFMILIILFTIFVTQNAGPIDIKAFFWKFQMSAVVLISITGFVGLILGFILAKIFDSQSRKKRKEKETPVIKNEEKNNIENLSKEQEQNQKSGL